MTPPERTVPRNPRLRRAPNEDENGSLPLTRAAAAGDLDAIRRELAAGADVRHENLYQQTPLVAALVARRSAAARVLLEAGSPADQALRLLLALKDLTSLEVLAEVCGPELKRPYLWSDAPPPGPREDLRELLEALRTNRASATPAKGGFVASASRPERRIIREFLAGRHPNPADRLPPLRHLAAAYPFAPAPHVALAEALVETDHHDEAIFHLETAGAMDQLDLDIHELLNRSLRRKSGEGPAPDLKTRFCPMPFETLVTSADGRAYLCCPSWLPLGFGNIEEQSWEELWNAPEAREIRRSIVDGDFTYCSRNTCPRFQDDSLPRKDTLTDPRFTRAIRDREFALPLPPRYLVLGYDLTCNLECPSCRTELIVADEKERLRQDRIFEKVLKPALDHVETFELSGGGEFLSSSHCRHVLSRISPERYPRLRLVLVTNGLLLSEEEWNRHPNWNGIVKEIHFSVDAATPETYARVRRGGDFARMMKNLEFLAGLRREGRIDHMTLNLIVQQANFREMKGLIGIGRRLGVDRVKMSRITNWGTWSPEAFARVDVASARHPEHGAFLETLRDPVFADPVVDLYNIRTFRKAAAR